MKANISKSQVMAWDVNPNGEHNTRLNCSLNGVQLQQVECYEYLGIIIDTKLSFEQHEKKKLNGCKSKLGALRPILSSDSSPGK